MHATGSFCLIGSTVNEDISWLAVCFGTGPRRERARLALSEGTAARGPYGDKHGGDNQHRRDQARELSTLHIHHGEETYYVLGGATIETPDGKREAIPTGAIGMNARDVPHGAYKVVGDTILKLLAVQIVDKGKPLYDKPDLSSCIINKRLTSLLMRRRGCSHPVNVVDLSVS
jgi:hypothetical protein